MADEWILPDGVSAVGDQQNVRYDGAGPWNSGDACAGGLRPGTRTLARYIREHFEGVTPCPRVCDYACRPNTGARDQLSVHGTGRAIDAMLPLIDGKANPLGDVVANWLVMNADALGVQYIIWNHRSWRARGDPPRLRVYGGPNPHIDHVHLELNEDGASERTAWFQSGGPNVPPDIVFTLAGLRARTLGKVVATVAVVAAAAGAGLGAAKLWSKHVATKGKRIDPIRGSSRRSTKASKSR